MMNDMHTGWVIPLPVVSQQNFTRTQHMQFCSVPDTVEQPFFQTQLLVARTVLPPNSSRPVPSCCSLDPCRGLAQGEGHIGGLVGGFCLHVFQSASDYTHIPHARCQPQVNPLMTVFLADSPSLAIFLSFLQVRRLKGGVRPSGSRVSFVWDFRFSIAARTLVTFFFF